MTDKQDPLHTAFSPKSHRCPHYTTHRPFRREHFPDSLMLTSLLIGLIVMVLYKPRTWCAFCPMGTMTQSICKLKNKD